MGKKMWSYMDKQIKELINPLMEGKGYVFSHPDRDTWQWDKYIDDIYQSVAVYDAEGRICMSVGEGIDQKTNHELLKKLENPRTTEKQWGEGIRGWEGKEELLRNIFLDCHEILEKFCDETIQECVEAVKKRVPTSKHYDRFRAEYDTLSEEYYKKYDMGNKNILEILADIKKCMEPMCGKEVEEVETELLGMAAAYEKRILEEYGGEKGVNEQFKSCYIEHVGKNGELFNFLVDIFAAWDVWEYWNTLDGRIKELYSTVHDNK